MSQPNPYNRVTSFTTDQAVAPTAPLNGANVDAELNGVKTTLDQVLTNLAVIQRDDTRLANASVGLDQFDTTVVVGFNLPTAWATGVAYAVTTSAVFNGQKLYRCLISHTSGTFATDLAAAKWVLLADFGASFGTAANVAFTPAQGLASTNVQAAIVEHKVVTDDITGFRAKISGGLTTAGTSSAYLLTTANPFVSLAAMDKQPITFIPHATSAAAATLAVDGLAAKKVRTATGVDLTIGALLIGTPYQVVYYNAVGEFILTGYGEVFNNVTINGTLAAVGAQTYTGAAQFNGTVAIAAGGSMAGTITGAPTFSGGLTFSGNPTFSGKPTFNGLYHLSSAAYASTAAGDWEFDGSAFANNVLFNNRGISPSVHYLSLSADQTGGNVATVQTWFPGGGPTTYNTTSSSYFFEGMLNLVRSAGTTSHTISFLLGGTATYSPISGIAFTKTSAGEALAAVSAIRFDVATATVVIAADANANQSCMLCVSGILRVQNAGTLIPQFQYSVAPGGAPTIKANSYFRLWPMGASGSSIGNWT